MKKPTCVVSMPSDLLYRFCKQLLRPWISILFVVGTVTPPASLASEAEGPVAPGTRLSLALVGYNYTSRYIDTFSANGQVGGNLYVSSPTSGGGGNVCCVTYVQGRPAGEVTVRRQSGGYMFRVPGGLADGSTHLVHDFFREIKVKVDPRIPSRPQNSEVHFYPDGHVEAAITGECSPPRLVYSKSREDRSDFPRCPDEKEPTE